MNKQHRQYVILIVVLLACAASVFFGVRSILHSNDEMTTFAVGDWEGITLPRYHGPAVYSTPVRQGSTVTLPMTSTSSRALFHHNAIASYRTGVKTTQRVQPNSGAYRVYQTSDHEMHSIGSGSGASGTASSGTTNYQQSSPSASFSVPTIIMSIPSVRTRAQTLAVNNINTATTSSVLADAETPASPRMLGLRRAKPGPDDPGYDGEWRNGGGGETDWWYYDEWEGDWIAAQKGDLRPAGDGNFYRYEGNGEWTLVDDQGDPVGTPIGDIPWLMLLMALVAYSTCRVIKKKENK